LFLLTYAYDECFEPLNYVNKCILETIAPGTDDEMPVVPEQTASPAAADLAKSAMRAIL